MNREAFLPGYWDRAMTTDTMIERVARALEKEYEGDSVSFQQLARAAIAAMREQMLARIAVLRDQHEYDSNLDWGWTILDEWQDMTDAALEEK